MHWITYHWLQVASTTWFVNFLSMAGVRPAQIPDMLDMLPERNNTDKNWEGEQGGRGIRALTRYLRPPELTNSKLLQQRMRRTAFLSHR